MHCIELSRDMESTVDPCYIVSQMKVQKSC